MEQKTKLENIKGFTTTEGQAVIQQDDLINFIFDKTSRKEFIQRIEKTYKKEIEEKREFIKAARNLLYN